MAHDEVVDSTKIGSQVYISMRGDRQKRWRKSNPCRSGAHQAGILTDTMAVDFGPYMTRIMQIVRLNWYSLMPPSVYPQSLQRWLPTFLCDTLLRHSPRVAPVPCGSFRRH